MESFKHPQDTFDQMQKKIIIFGTGQAGLRAYGHYKHHCEIVCFADNDKTKQKDGLVLRTEDQNRGSLMEVIAADAIFDRIYDQVIVASMYSTEIIAQLLELGIESERIGIACNDLLRDQFECKSKPVLEKVLELGGEKGVVAANVNGLNLFVPTMSIRMFGHCLFPTDEMPYRYFIENVHLNWLLERCGEGDHVIDVGASCGFLTAAFSRHVGVNGRVTSFEPSRGSGRLLKRLIELNNLDNVTHFQEAVFDRLGETEFTEYLFDESAEVMWKPETSALSLGQNTSAGNLIEKYSVRTTTLDELFFGKGRIDAIKIDIEGYENFALRGALKVIADSLPAIAIDIHQSVEGGGDTEDNCREILSAIGYNCIRREHVLLAESPHRIARATQ